MLGGRWGGSGQYSVTEQRQEAPASPHPAHHHHLIICDGCRGSVIMAAIIVFIHSTDGSA